MALPRCRNRKYRGLFEREMIQSGCSKRFMEAIQGLQSHAVSRITKVLCLWSGRTCGPSAPFIPLDCRGELQAQRRGLSGRKHEAHRSQGGQVLSQLLGQELSESSVHWIWSGLPKCQWLRIQSGRLGLGPPFSPLFSTLNKSQVFTGLRPMFSEAPSNSEIFSCFKGSLPGNQ